jgi:hypothetical protein
MNECLINSRGDRVCRAPPLPKPLHQGHPPNAPLAYCRARSYPPAPRTRGLYHHEEGIQNDDSNLPAAPGLKSDLNENQLWSRSRSGALHGGVGRSVRRGRRSSVARLARRRPVMFVFAGLRLLRSHHLAVSLRLTVGTKTPLACRRAPAPAAALARSSHTASRNARR